MTLITKESSGSYNQVVNKINQDFKQDVSSVDSLLDDKSNKQSELQSQIDDLNYQTSRLLKYVQGLFPILNQIGGEINVVYS